MDKNRLTNSVLGQNLTCDFCPQQATYMYAFKFVVEYALCTAAMAQYTVHSSSQHNQERIHCWMPNSLKQLIFH